MSTVAATIAQQRLANQRLLGEPLATPAEVVSWLGAVQAQEYQGAAWALSQRLRGATSAAIEHAFTDGAILRTHVMRPTWHFVTPADIRWLLDLTGPRLNTKAAGQCRQYDLDDALFARSNAAIEGALRGGHQLTRAEITTVLAVNGIIATGMRLILILQRAEADALICSGPRRGKQFTYALLAERAPRARRLPREAALAELARRYFTGHGPATVRDCARWSGVTISDVRAGIEGAGAALAHKDMAGETYWCAATPLPTPTSGDRAFLLSTYDEFLVGYSSFDALRRGGRSAEEVGAYDSTLVIDGRVVGTWRRVIHKAAVLVTVTPFVPLSESQRMAVAAEAERYGAFLGLPARLTIA